MSLYKRGDIWWYKFQFCGQVIRDSAKTESKTLARDAERARRKQLEEGFNGITRTDRVVIFDNAADAWLEGRTPHVAPKSEELYRLALSHLKREFGGLLLSNISADCIGRYQARRTAEGAAGRTVNMEVGVLRAVLKKYRFWGTISDGVQFLKERRDVGRAISPEEETLLLQTAGERRYSDSPFYVIVVLALNTAMRSQEIKTLRWCQLDLINRTITVGESKTDAGSGRMIPLNQAAMAVLSYWRCQNSNSQPEHYIFPSCENHVIDPAKPIKSFRTAWRNATAKAGLTGLRFHDLRHTAITKLAETLASDQTIMSIAGHVSRRMLEHYSHIRMHAKRTALDAISQSVFRTHRAQNWAQLENPGKSIIAKSLKNMAGPTRLELATSCVTGRRSNQLNYGPVEECKPETPSPRHSAWLCHRKADATPQ